MDKPWKAILAFVGVFIAGAIFGGFFTLRSSAKRQAHEGAIAAPVNPTAVSPGKSTPAQPSVVQAMTTTATPAPQPGKTPPQDRNVMIVMRQLAQRVNPTPEQHKAMRTIVSRATEDLQRLQRDHWQDVTRTYDRMYEDLGAVLTPEQRVQLEQMRQEGLDRARKAREKQRLESQSKNPPVRPNAQSPSGQPIRNSGPPEAANPPR